MRAGRDIDAALSGQKRSSHGGSRTSRSYSASTSSTRQPRDATFSGAACAAAMPMVVNSEP